MDKSIYDSYMRAGISYMYVDQPFSNLEEVIESLKAQYVEDYNIQDIVINGDNVRIVILGTDDFYPPIKSLEETIPEYV